MKRHVDGCEAIGGGAAPGSGRGVTGEQCGGSCDRKARGCGHSDGSTARRAAQRRASSSSEVRAGPVDAAAVCSAARPRASSSVTRM
jgi:hypothetical protein